MKERILAYRRRIDDLITTAPPETDWKAVMEEHLIQVGFFQHERLIHLIVTVTFALLLMIAIGVFLTVPSLCLGILILLFLVLLIPYIGHYYLLENEVQKMYAQYDKLLTLLKNAN